RYIVQYTNEHGKRKTLSLGKCSNRHANAVAGYLDDVSISRKNGQPMQHTTAAWLAALQGDLRRRCEDLG
ncbi:MAG: hypothetical protein ACPGYV_12540, partial [Phycisphaeraceae bacterium]